MKKAVYILSIFLASIYGCSKDDAATSPYIGSYKGQVIDSGFNLIGTFIDTLNDYTIIIANSSASAGNVFLHNGLLINTKYGKVEGNKFSMERKLVSKDEFFEVYEWAEGTYLTASKITWTVNFYRESFTNNVVVSRIRRSGVFVKD